jgi:uncharacterized protein (DUF58 family)
VTRRASPRLRAYLILGAGGLIAGTFLGRPEPVIIVAPLLIAAILALSIVRDPDLSVVVALSSDRVLEGDDVEINIDLESSDAVRWLELAVALPAGLVPDGGLGVVGLRLEPGVARRLAISASARRWGVHRIERVAVRMRDRFGFFAYERRADQDIVLRAFPRPATLRRAIRAAETQAFAGDEVARLRGDGIEFADVRPYAPGDPIRSVNWRLSSSRPELHINLLHPERSSDVVILLDTFTDIPGQDEQGSLATAVRGASGLANYYLRRRDHVGLITFGASIRWLVPAMGLAQGYRIVEALLDARAAMTLIWKGVDLIPPRSLPPNALVVAFTPLLDKRTVEALLDLRARGFDLAVIELAPEAFIATPADPFAATARQLWRIQREILRDRFQRMGVPVAAWSPGEPLEAVMEEVRAFRRNTRRASA